MSEPFVYANVKNRMILIVDIEHVIFWWKLLFNYLNDAIAWISLIDNFNLCYWCFWSCMFHIRSTVFIISWQWKFSFCSFIQTEITYPSSVLELKRNAWLLLKGRAKVIDEFVAFVELGEWYHFMFV